MSGPSTSCHSETLSSPLAGVVVYSLCMDAPAYSSFLFSRHRRAANDSCRDLACSPPSGSSSAGYSAEKGVLTSVQDPCYPESAVVIGSDPPKMGTDGPRGPASINPGADCTNPGRYKGEMSPGNAFPVYVSAAWCDGDEVWKVNYDLYYVSVEAFPFLSEQGC